MKVCHTLICFFFLTLQDGNIGLINAEIHSFTGTEGQNITVECPFTNTGERKFLCTVKYVYKCEEDILEMNNNSTQRGRYSMEYKETPGGSRLDVTITQLTKSDSGRYGCGLDIPSWFDQYKEFKIIVTGAPSTSKPNLTLRPSLTSIQSASTPATTQSFRRSSTETTEEEQTETPAGRSGVLLYVGLTLLLFSVAVLMYCKKRASKPKEPPVEIEHANVTQAKRVYEETREDGRQSRSPPVEISSIYTVAIYKPNGVKTSDDYSFAAATASRPLNKIEDDWSELVYTRCRRLTQQRPPWSCR